MDPASLDFWEWFYATGNEGKSLDAEEMQRAIEERWHPDLVLIQDPRVSRHRRRVPRLLGSDGCQPRADRVLG